MAFACNRRGFFFWIPTHQKIDLLDTENTVIVLSYRLANLAFVFQDTQEIIISAVSLTPKLFYLEQLYKIENT